METAYALSKIISYSINEEKTPKQEAIERAARICGKSNAWVFQYLGLLRLCPEVQEYVASKKLPFQVGVALTHLMPKYQISFANHIIGQELNFKKALDYIRKNREQETLSSGGRMRTPSRDYTRLRIFLENIDREIANFLDTPPNKFVDMFRHRPAKELSDLTFLASDLSEDLEDLAAILKAIGTSQMLKPIIT
jgi:hypothetical protein